MTIRIDRSVRPRGMARVAGLVLGVAIFGATGLSGVQAQNDDVTVGGGASLAEAPSASDIQALVDSIIAEILGGAAGADDGTSSSGGDINVGGNMGGSVTMGGGMSGGISIGGGSGGTSVGESESDE